MQKLSLSLIGFYQVLISPLFFGGACKYEISCSEYTKQSVSKCGVLKGLYLGIRRIISCH